MYPNCPFDVEEGCIKITPPSLFYLASRFLYVQAGGREYWRKMYSDTPYISVTASFNYHANITLSRKYHILAGP